MGLGLSVPAQGAAELDVLGLVGLCRLDVVGYHDDKWLFAACAGALWSVFPAVPPNEVVLDPGSEGRATSELLSGCYDATKGKATSSIGPFRMPTRKRDALVRYLRAG